MISNELLEKRIAILFYELYISNCLERHHCLDLEIDEVLYKDVLSHKKMTIKKFNDSRIAGEAMTKFVLECYSSQYEKDNEPIDLKVVVETDFAGFVVSGKFKEGCSKRIKLGSQKVIKDINIDMINRIYTLIIQRKIRY